MFSRLLTIVLWLCCGPGMFGLSRIFDPVAAVASLADSLSEAVVDEVWGLLWFTYFSVYSVAVGAAAGNLIWEAFRSAYWRRKEGQTSKTWTGGTLECLLAGNVVRWGLAPTSSDTDDTVAPNVDPAC